jgi:hypothetical protein
MTEADAWEIYDSEAGKQGRPSAKFKEAKLWLIEKELLNKDDAKSTTEKKDKKPPLELKIINNPLEISVDLQKEIYMEAFVYIQDKRNFDFNYYLTGRYGITSAVMKAWEQDPEMRNLRVIAAELMELKMSDALCDKWSGGNPLGLMLRLKSAYGWNDKGEGGSMMPDGNIGIIAEYTEEDMAAMDYGDSNEEYLNEDSE